MKPIVQLILAVAGIAGAGLCWLNITSSVDVPPVTDGQPATVSVVYHPSVMLLAWLLATTAGVLAVYGIAGLRRRRASQRLGVYTP